MPAPRDLVGEKFGSLTVAKFAGTDSYGGRRGRFWWCRCSCGREDRVFQGSLVRGRVTACNVCRRGPCLFCGGEITRDTRRQTCSPECEVDNRRRTARALYAKQSAEDPNFNSRRWQTEKIRMKEDPEKRQRFLERQRAFSRRKRQDPDYVEKEREYYATWYEKNRAKVIETRKESMKLRPPEDLKRRREYERLWRQKWREEVAKDPERYRDYLEYQRIANQKQAAKKALSDLMITSSKLGERFNDIDHDNDK